MERDLEALLPLPNAPYDASDKRLSRVSSLSLVRYRSNDYSVPVAYGHRDVVVRGYVGEVVISCGSEIIARHPRSYRRDDFVFDPVHYLPLLERKTGALDQAAPLADWKLPEEFGRLRRLAGVEDGQTRQAGVRAGAEAAGELPQGGGVRGCARCPQARRHKLRCGQAPRAVQAGGPTAAARPRTVSLPAQGQRGQDVRQRLHDARGRRQVMSAKATVLLEHHLKELRLPTFLREYGKLAGRCAAEDVDHPGYLLRLAELELIDRHHRKVDRRIRAARFPTTKSLDSFDFLAIPSVNKQLVMQLARCEYVDRRENVIAMGNSGTGKTHVALGLGLAACQRGLSVGFTTAAALVHELIEASDERRLLNLQKTARPPKAAHHPTNSASCRSPRPAPNCCSRSSASATSEDRSSSPPTCPSTSGPRCSAPSGSPALLLDRLTHLTCTSSEMNGQSYRLKQSRQSHDTAVCPQPRRLLARSAPRPNSTSHRSRHGPIDLVLDAGHFRWTAVPRWYIFTPPRGLFSRRP